VGVIVGVIFGSKVAVPSMIEPWVAVASLLLIPCSLSWLSVWLTSVFISGITVEFSFVTGKLQPEIATIKMDDKIIKIFLI
jgi:hypothetical protein